MDTKDPGHWIFNTSVRAVRLSCSNNMLDDRNTMNPHAEVIELRRDVATDVETCFRYWTDAKLLEGWWGPKDESGRAFRAEVETWRPAAGSSWRITLHAPDGERYLQTGTFLVVAPRRQLSFTAGMAGEGEVSIPTRIEVGFREDEDGGTTRLTFLQTGFTDVAARESYQEGWEQCLDRLVDAVVGAEGRSE